MSVAETAQKLQTNIETGLTDVQVRELQQAFGPNKLDGEGGVRWYSILAKQVSNAMILVSRTYYCRLSFLFFPSLFFSGWFLRF